MIKHDLRLVAYKVIIENKMMKDDLWYYEII